ncbi:MAG: hypothetical protein ACTSXG_04445, partial [Alphaproteobacteria bacterium]
MKIFTIYLFAIVNILNYKVHAVDKHYPDYVVFDMKKGERPLVLKTPAKQLSFPLSKQDTKDVKILEGKFD